MRLFDRSANSSSKPSAWARVWLLSWMVLGATLINFGIERGQTPTPSLVTATPTSFVPAPDDSTQSPRRRTKNIEQVQAGDIVLAWDEETGDFAPKKVVRVFRNHTEHLRIVTVRASDDAREQTLKTTNEHPFYVVGEGWIEAQFLRPGQELLQADNRLATVVDSLLEPHPEGLPVFNFEVEDAHTYFVSARTSDLPILVHNTCVHGNSKLSTKPQHRYEIIERSTGVPHKTGVSGGRIRADGKSARAESQVRALNSKGGDFYSVIVETAENRQAILAAEKAAVGLGRSLGSRLPGNQRPLP
ncbi:MAG: hypothetical protein H6821_02180 [Planctomycetaceae bacterium]|nr:hypothetical protein [Planctomycetaceae bacterium]